MLSSKGRAERSGRCRFPPPVIACYSGLVKLSVTILQDIKDYDLQTVPVQYPVNISSHNTSGELLEFLDCIVNDKPIRTTALEGAKTVIASLAAVKSSKTGMPVRPNYNI